MTISITCFGLPYRHVTLSVISFGERPQKKTSWLIGEVFFYCFYFLPNSRLVSFRKQIYRPGRRTISPACNLIQGILDFPHTHTLSSTFRCSKHSQRASIPEGALFTPNTMASTKRKAPTVKVAQPTIKKSAKPIIKPRVNEVHASVAAVPKNVAARKNDDEAVVEISSDSDSHDDDASMDGMDDVDEREDGSERQVAANGLPLRNDPIAEIHASAVNRTNSNKAEDEDRAIVSDDEPTFGDLVREQETVDVPAMLGLLQNATEGDMTVADRASSGLSKPSPSLASLGNLLNAALRNNDDANLEVCFNTTSDATWVRNTIQRMDPALAGPLLQKLAARMYRRPGRAQTLIGWVQWTLITHGGALASQPGVTKSLQELHRVLEERARGLNSLLLLKGKLDMLEAQMQLRRGQRGGARLTLGFSTETGGVRAIGGGGGRRQGGRGRRSSRGPALVDEEEDEVAVYVEGQEDGPTGHIAVAGAGPAAIDGLGESDDEVEEMGDDEEDSDDAQDREDEGDDDMEEMDGASVVEEDEIDFDDVDEDEEEEEEEDSEDRSVAPPSKMQKKSANTFSKRR